ncbi:MAG: patatin-like phospholipase family protein [Gemmatimonadales bacterium]
MSGGGAKAAAHVGAHRALTEEGLHPSRYVGTSMGAVVAACFACGLAYEDVMQRMLGVTRRDVAIPSASLLLGPLAQSLLGGRRLRETLAGLVPARRFSELATPLTVTAVSVETGELVLFGGGGDGDVPLIDALWASCALPVFYPPVEIEGRAYADGGLRAVLPIGVAASFEPDWIFAVDIGPSFDATPTPRSFPTPPLVRAHNAAMRILMAAQAEAAVARWQEGPVPLVVVEPPTETSATFAVADVPRYVEEGYRAAVAALRARSG